VFSDMSIESNLKETELAREAYWLCHSLFEANHWNPQVFVKNVVPMSGRWMGQAACQVATRKFKLMKVAS
jgi:hypothetical protein